MLRRRLRVHEPKRTHVFDEHGQCASCADEGSVVGHGNEGGRAGGGGGTRRQLMAAEAAALALIRRDAAAEATVRQRVILEKETKRRTRLESKVEAAGALAAGARVASSGQPQKAEAALGDVDAGATPVSLAARVHEAGAEQPSSAPASTPASKRGRRQRRRRRGTGGCGESMGMGMGTAVVAIE